MSILVNSTGCVLDEGNIISVTGNLATFKGRVATWVFFRDKVQSNRLTDELYLNIKDGLLLWESNTQPLPYDKVASDYLN